MHNPQGEVAEEGGEPQNSTADGSALCLDLSDIDSAHPCAAHCRCRCGCGSRLPHDHVACLDEATREKEDVVLAPAGSIDRELLPV